MRTTLIALFGALLFMTSGELLSQCSINAPTVTSISCQTGSSPSVDDDAISFLLNLSGTNTSANGYYLSVDNGATITPQEGIYNADIVVDLGPGSAGSGNTYTVTLTDKSDPNCTQTATIADPGSCSPGCPADVFTVCDDASNSLTLTADSGLTGVEWFNSADTPVGTGVTLIVDSNTPGLADGSESFYYTAVDGNACSIELCCPVMVETELCGPFDLALQKVINTTATPGPFSPGDNVTFTVTVYNQGVFDADNIVVEDYIPSNMSFVSSPDFSLAGAQYTATIASLTAGASQDLSITLQIASDFQGTTLTNNAEIIAYDDDNDPTTTPMEDEDSPISTIDGSSDDESELDTDNDTDDEAPGTPGTADNPNDADDYDPAQVTVEQTFDLALVKTVNSVGTDSPLAPGGTVLFNIEVINQGTLDAFNVQVNDYIPSGLTLTDSDWSESAGVATLLNTIASIPAGQSEVVSITFTVDASFMGESITNDAEIASADDDTDPTNTPPTDEDSTPGDNGNPNDPNNDDITDTTGGDDQDPETIPVVQTFDLALTKVVNMTATPAPFMGGSTVQFTITVVNQGTLDAFTIDVADYSPVGLSDVTLVAGQSGVVENAPNDFTVATVAAGTSYSFEVEATIDVDFMGSSLINDAEITSADDDMDATNTPPTDVDSTPGDNGTPNDTANDNDVADTTGGDDQDPAEVPVGQVFDLALVKTINTAGTASPIVPGATVVFDIEVINQGSLDAFNVNVNDYIPAGLVLADANWSEVGGVADLNAPIASIPAGMSETVSIAFTVSTTFQGTSITNNAEIASADDDTDPNNTPPTDVDSTPNTEDGTTPDPNNDDTTATNGSDDYDPETIVVEQTFDLALVKIFASSSTTPIVPGSDVTFNLEVFNQGTVDAYNVQLSDYVPAGLVLNDVNWSESAGVASLNNEIGFIGVGQSEVVSITFTVDASFMGESITNDAEIASADDDTDPTNTPPTDEDSTPGDNGNPNDPNNDDITDTTGGDDQDPETIPVVQTFDLALTKVVNMTATPAPFMGGSTVQFTITVVNQGTLDAFTIDVADYSPVGLSDVTLVAGQSGVVENAPNDFTVATVAAGTSYSFEVEATIDVDFMGSSLINDAEITSADDDMDATNTPPTDVDSTPGDNGTPNDTANDNDVADTTGGDDQDPAEVPVGQVFDLAIDKVIDAAATPAPYFPNSLVTFDITVYNQGTIDATDIIIEDYLPTGTSFESSPDFSLQGAEYLANIATLAAGTSTTLEITIRIDDDFMGESLVNNVEIVSAQNSLGLVDQDDDLANEDGSSDDSSELDTDNDVDDEAPGTPGTADNPDDVDDYDPAFIPVTQIFDLALEKIFNSSSTTPIIPGSDVTFTLEVTNQGTLDAYNVNIVDYIPAGLTLNDTDWTESSPGVAYLNNDIVYIARGEMESVNITFMVDPTFMGTEIINWAEINQADDNNDPTDGFPTDIDSTPDDDQFNSPGETDDLDDDGVTDEDGTMGGDEDDHDPALINITQSFDLALQKVFSSWDDTDMNGMIDQGENVTFTVTVYNQGNLDATNVVVTDYVPTGMLFNAADNTDFSGGPLTPTATVASLPMGADVDLEIVLQVDPTFMGMMAVNNAEITDATNALGQPDDDNPLDVVHGTQDDGSELDTDNDTDDEFPGTPGTEDNDDDVDDYDPAMIMIGQVFDLALFKIYDSYNDLSGDGVLSPGDDVTFLITVINQGTLDAYNVQVSDYIPDGLTLNDPQWNNTQNVTIAQLNTVHPFLAAGDQTTRTITFTIDEMWRGESIVNWAEISAADDNDDPTDGFPEDEDSTPNSNQGDDTFGGDNVVDNTNNDEDDHDPAEINPVIELDLALAKKDQSDDPASAYGEIRTFDIEVTNQGTILATEFTVVDYIPCGFEFVSTPGSNPGWTYNSATRIAEFIYDETILYPNDVATIEIQLEVVYCDGDVLFNWTNYAEISHYDDDFNDFNQDIPDIDSDPDATNFDDPGGQPWTDTDDWIDGDGSGSIGSNDLATDEDDHDPERVEIFDLALRKTISDATPGPYSYYDMITFDIEVFNQGNIGAQNVVVTDYIPEGYAYDAALNPAWSGTYPNVSTTITDLIPVAGSTTVSITLQIIQTDGGEVDWFNYAEVTAAENEDGEDRTDDDIDSNPGSDGDDERDVEPGDDDDDDIDSQDPGGEEDDHDPAGIEIYDLAQTKTTIDNGPFEYGDDIVFTITVYNQGSIEASSIEITDYIPCGFAYNSGNDANGWSFDATTGNATVTIPGNLVPEASTTIDIVLTVQQCLDMDVSSFTNVTEISNSESNDPDEPAEDIDSDEDTNPTDDEGGTPDSPEDDHVGDDSEDGNMDGITDEDDHDPERVEVFDLALRKELVTAGPYQYGDLLEFNITVCNQGNVNAANIVVSDYLPAGYSFDFANNPGWGGTAAEPTYAIPGVLIEDTCTDFPVFMTIEMTTGGEKDWFNYAEITEATDEDGNPVTDADSNPGSNGDDENAVEPGDDEDNDMDSTDKGGEEDDHDPAGIEIYDLAQRKTTADAGPFRYGDDVIFTIEVFNQGSIEASGITVTDFIPCGFAYNASNDANGWSYDAATGNATLILPGTLVPGASQTVDITLKVQQCLDMDELTFTNFTEISDSESEDPDEPADDIDSDEDDDPTNDDDPSDNEITGDPNDPVLPDEDDHDPEEIQVFDLALKKELITHAPYAYGDLIEFKITVCNQGNVTAANIVVEDYLPVGYTFDFANNPGWGGSADDPTYTVPGTLAEDTCTEFAMFATLVQTSGGEKDWINYAEITDATDEDGNDVTDADSDPGSDGPGENDVEPGDDADDDLDSTDLGGEEDDHDPAGPEIYDLAQIKTTDATAPFRYGDFVDFDVTVFNQGSIEAVNIEVTDYIPCGFRYDPSNDAAGWSYDQATGNATITIAGPLAPGSSMVRSIRLQIQECYEDEANAWTNITEISDSESNDPDEPADDIDSDEDDDPENDPGGQPDTPNDDETDGSGNPDCCETVATIELTDGIAIYPDGTQSNDIIGFEIDNQLLSLSYPFDAGLPAEMDILVAELDALGYTLVYEQLSSPVPTEQIFMNITILGGEITNIDIRDGFLRDVTANACCTFGPDEDDHDPETVEVFDLAIRKFIENKGPYQPGEIAEYIIDVFNQGNVDAYSIEVTDYLNEGYIFDAAANPGWALTSTDPDLLTYTIDGPVAPGDSVRLLLNLEVFVPDGADINSWYNETEISGADNDTDPNNTDPVDGDSTPDQDPDNDNDLVDGDDDDPIFDEEDDNDNVIDEHVDDPFGEGDDDEDDNDAADILVTGGLGDTVWKDLDGDGIQDINEPGVANVLVTLLDCDGNVLRTQVTDNEGFYFFNNLLPGDYQVQFDISGLPEGCDFTYQDVGGDDEADSDVDLTGLGPCVNVEGGEFDSTYDAGLLILASIGDYVWHDLDGDGVQEAGEPGIGGVTVNLYDGDGNFQGTTTTDPTGYYLFDNLYPGDYYLEFIDPEGFDLTFPNQGINDATDSDVDGSNGPGTTQVTTLDPGEHDPDWDAGYYICVPIGDLVWYDVDEDDVWDSNENGINGLVVNLWRENADGTYSIYETTYTGHKPGTPSDDGYYKFCAPPGTYYVEVVLPPYGLVPAVANVGGNEENDSDVTNANGIGTTDSFTVLSGQEKCDLGHGYYPMAELGDRVWNDANENGIQDTGEAPISGVVVKAYDMAGVKVAESVTDANGNYKLDYLAKDDYYLHFTPPSGMSATIANVGNDESMDSDVDGSYGANTTSMYSLMPGDDIPTVDVGFKVSSVLPVEWLSIEAEHMGEYNRVKWSTASEQNASHYAVERRYETEQDYVQVGKVAANGTTSDVNDYSSDDYDIAEDGVYYYRVKQVDVDGKYDYSEVVSVNVVRVGDDKIELYPNPTVDMVNIDVTLSRTSTIRVSIWDAEGKLVRADVLDKELSAGFHNNQVDISYLVNGVYTVKVNIGTKVTNKRLIVLKN